jgi:hypothetical protein
MQQYGEAHAFAAIRVARSYGLSLGENATEWLLRCVLGRRRKPARCYDFPMTVPEQVAQFIQSQKPSPYCDSCIQNSLGLKRHQQVQQAASGGAASGGFVRGAGTCSACGKDAIVTHA